MPGKLTERWQARDPAEMPAAVPLQEAARCRTKVLLRMYINFLWRLFRMKAKRGVAQPVTALMSDEIRLSPEEQELLQQASVLQRMDRVNTTRILHRPRRRVATCLSARRPTTGRTPFAAVRPARMLRMHQVAPSLLAPRLLRVLRRHRVRWILRSAVAQARPPHRTHRQALSPIPVIKLHTPWRGREP